MVTGLLGAVGLFIATNIDDIIVLSLFFARGAGQAGTTLRILAGQYLGFAGILAATILVTLGADAFLPTEAIPYFGLIPLALGLRAAWQAWQGNDDDDDDAKVSGFDWPGYLHPRQRRCLRPLISSSPVPPGPL